MTKLLLLLAVSVGLVAVSFAQTSEGETGDARPAVYDMLRRGGIGRILDFTCSIKQLLQDREVSDRVYKIVDGVQDIIKNGYSCAKDLVFKTLADQTTSMGKTFTNIGGSNFIDNFWRNPLTTVMSLIGLFSSRSIDFGQIGREVEQLSNKIVTDCGGSVLKDYKSDFDFLRQKFDGAIQKTDK